MAEHATSVADGVPAAAGPATRWIAPAGRSSAGGRAPAGVGPPATRRSFPAGRGAATGRITPSAFRATLFHISASYPDGLAIPLVGVAFPPDLARRVLLALSCSRRTSSFTLRWRGARLRRRVAFPLLRRVLHHMDFFPDQFGSSYPAQKPEAVYLNRVREIPTM